MVDQIARTKGEEAADLFEQYVSSYLHQDNFKQGDELIRLSGKEADELKAKYADLLTKLPDTVERAKFRNGVSRLLGHFSGSPTETATVGRLVSALDGAFQAKIAAGGVQLQAQAGGPTKTNIDLTAVKTGEAAAAVLEAVLGSHLGDDTKWTINVDDSDPLAGYNGQKVRLSKEETNRLKALIDETYAKLSKKEAVEFHRRASMLFVQRGSAYENERKFPEILAYLSKGFDKKEQ